ncbi:uncharacterized protein LOC104879552 [Vitis vinifera]|uniref:uncharacterized protein LOC104879552 n=1 Tax=Vitis vinifera TaxID=29760 RepID=UPI00053F7DBE|nr:uncharacterized protein LOC104879552 [Vitis vinifera]
MIARHVPLKKCFFMLESPLPLSSNFSVQFRKHRLLSKMGRRQTLFALLLACLLLAASPHRYSAATKVQAGSKPREASASAAAAAGFSFATSLITLMNINKQAKGKKTRKSPSGPNPVGNQHPPSRP